jgi:hypothetical protein
MRKESIVRLDDDGEQKEFKIRQMSASRGERFFYQLLLFLLSAILLLFSRLIYCGLLFLNHTPYMPPCSLGRNKDWE